jgi:hypothetical protein
LAAEFLFQPEGTTVAPSQAGLFRDISQGAFMQKRLVSMMVGIVLATAPCQFAFGQSTTGNWATVQAVAVDDRVIVKQKDGKTIEGKMIEASETNLTISRNGKVVNIPRDAIRQIEHSTGKAAKGKWAAIGTGVGAAAGAGIGATKYRADRDDYGIYPIMGTLIGAGAGAVAGLLIGASRRKRELIYTAH